jgi:probable rRNA maturation factor
VFNRQKSRKLDTVLFRRLGVHLLEKLIDCPDYELGVHLIGAHEMEELNETFLGHSGSTDVITFDHHEILQDPDKSRLHGELFICVDDAEKQAREFRTTWQSEVARYLAHGILHLMGHDDTRPGPLRAMKREENKMVKELSRCFDLKKLERSKNAAGKR